MLMLKRCLCSGKEVRSLLSGLRTLVTVESQENILRCPSGDVVIPQTTVPELVYSKIEPFHKYVASECAVTGKKYTFEQIRVKSRNLSKNLRRILKLHDGDVVAILLPNTPEYLVSCLGILEAGLVITTLNPIYTQEEISKQLKDSSAKAIITVPESFETVRIALIAIKQKLPIISIKNKEGESIPRGAISFEELVNTTSDIPDIKLGSCQDLAFLPYSSGTTGLPKGVELTHNNVISMNAQAIHPDYKLFDSPSESFQDVIPGILPMFHIYGLTIGLLNAAVNGTKLVTIPKFTPDLFISVLRNHKITAIYVAPPLALFLANHPDVKSHYFANLNFLMSGAAPLGYPDEKRLQKKIGKNVFIFQGYGMTESTGLVTCASRKLLKYPKELRGSVGQPVPNTFIKVVKVGDTTGEPLGPNEPGEILIKGPQVMRGYRGRPTETEECFLNGWYKSGDIGHYSDDNMIFVTDRLKELIKVKGFQVAPAELEEIIRDFPLVQDVAVIGVPHPLFGEAPRAFVVPKNNTILRGAEIEHFVAAKTAKYKHLSGGVELVDSIPKNASGKILRRLLKNNYQQTYELKA